MRSLLKLLLGGLALGLLYFLGSVSAGMTGLEKVIVDVSVGVIVAVAFALFVIFSAAAGMGGPDRCDECGRPTDARLAYSEAPNTRNPPCRACKRPLPDSQWNA